MSFRIAALALCLGALPLLSHAQNVQNLTAQEVVELGGQMHAMGEACPQIPAQFLAQAKGEKKHLVMQYYGVSGPQFEQWYAQGMREGQNMWAGMSPQERQKTCNMLVNFTR